MLKARVLRKAPWEGAGMANRAVRRGAVEGTRLASNPEIIAPSPILVNLLNKILAQAAVPSGEDAA